MLDNFLITIILFSMLLSFLTSWIWKKRHFVKELYISKWVSIVIYVIAMAITIALLTIYFVSSRDLPYSWLYLLIVLLFDWIMLFAFCITFTTCVYLKNKMLYKKNIFITKQILLNEETEIIEKIDMSIIKLNNKSISISARYLTGNIRHLISKIKTIINY